MSDTEDKQAKPTAEAPEESSGAATESVVETNAGSADEKPAGPDADAPAETAAEGDVEQTGDDAGSADKTPKEDAAEAPAGEGGADDASPEQSSMEMLSELMLDSAEAANIAAVSANDSSELIIGSVAAFNESMEAVQKRQYTMFWVFAGLMVIAVSVGAVLLERFTQSALQADEIMLTVGKRVVQMDADVRRVENLREELDRLNKTNAAMNAQVTEALNLMKAYEASAQEREESGISRARENMDHISNRIGVKFEKFSGVVDGLQGKFNGNAIQLAKLGDEITELSIAINEMKDTKLIKKLDALIKLEQNRYYERLSEGRGLSQRPSAPIRYPATGRE